MARWLKADGTEEEVKPSSKGFSLQEVQKYVGGDVQLISLDKKQTMLVNQDGTHLGLPVNKQATQLLQDVAREAAAAKGLECRATVAIVGDVLVCEAGKGRWM